MPKQNGEGAHMEHPYPTHWTEFLKFLKSINMLFYMYAMWKGVQAVV